MDIIRIESLDTTLNTIPAAAALGNFDGVHIAHQALLKSVKDAAQLSAVFTFAEEAKEHLTTRKERLALLQACGMEKVFLAPFSLFRTMSCEDFVRYLKDKLACQLLICGFNFRFGKGAVGDADTLTLLAGQAGMQVLVHSEMRKNAQTVSSSVIRTLLAEGKPDEAAVLLGRPFSITGEVVHGFSVGKRLKTPTVNLPLPEGGVRLKNGVYASTVLLDGCRLPAVTNIGTNPTFARDRVTCETHLLHTSGDFYGRCLTVELEKFLRPEQKFPSEEALAAAIAADLEKAWQYHLTK